MHIKVKVIPQSSRLEFAGMVDGVVRVKLTKGAHDGEANEQLIDFLAKSFHLAKSEFRIVQGEHRRDKTIECISITSQQLHELIPSR